ncbi:MAG: hypothetical protein JW866_02920 [Ignavibacteriales bacterium]|nr:hypothetical protein [Ignavibacteriales bacterium]
MEKTKAKELVVLVLCAIVSINVVLIIGCRRNETIPTELETPSPIDTHQIPSFKLPVLVNASFYDKIKELLKPDDVVGARAPRSRPDVPLDLNKFQRALSVLNQVDEQEKGIKKSLVFSSKEDLKTYLSQIPSDITIISYNNESSLTPIEERETPEQMKAAVLEFSQLVHQSGRQMVFGPLNNDWLNLNNAGKLKEVLDAIDAAGVQGQGAMDQGGLNSFINFVEQMKSIFAQNKGQDVKLNVQLWLGRNSVEEIVSGFKEVEDKISIAVIFSDTDPNNDTYKILQQLRGTNAR